MNLKIRIILSIALFLSLMSFGQSFQTNESIDPKDKETYVIARKLAHSQNYTGALQTLDKILKKYPNHIESLMLKGDALFRMGEYTKGIENMKKAATLAPDFEPRNLFGVASMYYNIDSFQQAVDYFDKFLQYETSVKESYVKSAQKLRANAAFAAYAIKNPLPFEPKNMGLAINSEWPEYLPALTADGNTMVITRRVQGQEDFYISQKVNDVWQQAKSIGAPINTPDNEGAQAISADGKTIVYTRCNNVKDYGACDLLIAENINGQWTEPKNIGPSINSKHWESQPTLSSDGRTLYFVSNRPDGMGLKDIWMSTRSLSGEWQPASNVSDINTPMEDAAPFLHADGHTLYFITNGRPGMGGLDIFFSKKNELGKWGDAVNIGYPVNTKEEEAGIIVSFDGSKGYFSSEKNHKFERALDLYEFEMPLSARPTKVTYVKTFVTDINTNSPLQAMVLLYDINTKDTISTFNTRADGTAVVALPVGKEYGLHVIADNYTFYSDNFQLNDTLQITEPYEKSIALTPVKGEMTKGKSWTLNNVFFETGSAELSDKSYLELSQLIDFLQSNSHIRIKVNGHTDNVGTDTDNLRLSNDRALAVKKYLIGKGIEVNRIEHQGFGESKAIDTNETESGRKRNRRTEIEIL